MSLRALWKLLGPVRFEFTNKGGNGGTSAPPTSTQTSSSTLPDYAAPYFMGTLQGGWDAATQAYPNYQGPFVAPLTGNQSTGIAASGVAGANAGNLINQSGIGALNAAGSYNPGNVAQWMNPYQQGVTDIAKDQANRQFQQQQIAQNARAVQQGAFGGDREAIRQSEDQRNQNILLNNIQMQGDQGNYNTALTAMGTQAQTGLAGYNLANTIGNQGISGLMSTGGVEQGTNQAVTDAARTNFMNAATWPQQQANFMSGLLRGTPVQPSTTQTTYTAPPSLLSQLAGLGMGAAGLASLGKMFAKGGKVEGYADGGVIEGESTRVADDTLSSRDDDSMLSRIQMWLAAHGREAREMSPYMVRNDLTNKRELLNSKPFFRLESQLGMDRWRQGYGDDAAQKARMYPFRRYRADADAEGGKPVFDAEGY